MTSEYVSMKDSMQHYETLVDGLQHENTRLRTLVEDHNREKRLRDDQLEKVGKEVSAVVEPFKFETPIEVGDPRS